MRDACCHGEGRNTMCYMIIGGGNEARPEILKRHRIVDCTIIFSSLLYFVHTLQLSSWQLSRLASSSQMF
jgi:hypothetical protein